MSMILKLTGISTYTGAATQRGVGTEAVAVLKGQVCRFKDDIAEKVLTGHRLNAENEPIPYFTEVEEGTKIDHDFDPESKAAPAELVAAAAKTSQRAVVKRAAR